MNPKVIADYYSRDDVAEMIARASQGKEAVGAYPGGAYDSRPNVIQYASDVKALAKKGVSSFHISVENWKFPMQLSVDKNYDSLRSGWDLLIDIDSAIGMEGAKIAAMAVCEFLEEYQVSKYGIKFSGSRGFHICVPWNAFPKEIDYKPTELQYPEMPRIIINYMRERIKKKLLNELQKDVPDEQNKISEAVKKNDPYDLIDIENSWGPRHLFRAPYSFNEKTWFVSLPLTLEELKKFTVSMANLQNVKVEKNFFVEGANAEKLLIEAMDWHAMMKKEEIITKVQVPIFRQHEKRKITENYFPPCMQHLLKGGLKEGRKRTVFTLINFLHSMNWEWPEIEQKLSEWNTHNVPPLPRNYIMGQLNWHRQQNRNINPPNCYNDHFYKTIGLCTSEMNCGEKIKSPMNYPYKKIAQARKLQGPKEDKKTMKPEDLYSCDMCDKKYTSMSSLQGHRTRFHGAE